MKLKVFNNKKEKKKDKNIYLKLKKDINGVIVVVVDKEGVEVVSGNLLNITNQGIILHDGINENLGFVLNTHKQLLVID